jgi:hypothetical protein
MAVHVRRLLGSTKSRPTQDSATRDKERMLKRWDVMDSAFEPAGPFPIYVPIEGGGVLAKVIPASAIVGFPLETEPNTIHVYYEGNLYNSADLRRFADRAKFAAGRCRWFRLNMDEWQREHGNSPPPATEYGYVGYPTRAHAFVSSVELVQVAVYDDVLGIVAAIGVDQALLLRAWIGPTDPLDYFATGTAFERRRAASRPADGSEPFCLDQGQD